MDKLLAHRASPIPSLTALRDDVPPGLDKVVAKMMAKQPADRYQSMQEVVVALDKAKQPGGGEASGGVLAKLKGLFSRK
jgi:hypothetical protein